MLNYLKMNYVKLFETIWKSALWKAIKDIFFYARYHFKKYGRVYELFINIYGLFDI